MRVAWEVEFFSKFFVLMNVRNSHLGNHERHSFGLKKYGYPDLLVRLNQGETFRIGFHMKI